MKILGIFLNKNVFFYFVSPIYRWYFRKIKRIEAEKKLLLPENEHGAFLIRDSESRHNDYSLSGKYILVLQQQQLGANKKHFNGKINK